jgi:hypothetical protein
MWIFVILEGIDIEIGKRILKNRNIKLYKKPFETLKYLTKNYSKKINFLIQLEAFPELHSII